MFDFDKINSATKYPSIPTYHTIEGKGILNEETVTFHPAHGEVVLTEKVDGTNARIIVLPSGDWFIGSREDLLTARGDRIANPTLGIVAELKAVAEKLASDVVSGGIVTTFYLEVYGYKTSSAAKNYTSTQAVGHRLFDIQTTPMEVLEWDRERIASVREANSGTGTWAQEAALLRVSDGEGIPLTPRLGRVQALSLPVGEGSLETMFEWLKDSLPQTLVALDEGARSEFPEGIVLRSLDRHRIAKARFEDYRRTKSKGFF